METTVTTAKTFISNIRKHIEADDCQHCIAILKGSRSDQDLQPEQPQTAKSGATENVISR